MDKTDKYIRMCYEARKELKPYLRKHRDSDGCIGPDFEMGSLDGVDILIWLPKQCQLQRMLGDYIASELEFVPSDYDIKCAFLDFIDWMGKQYHNDPFTCVPTNNFDSGEQLWLAFVMQEIFNKKWDDEKWKIES